MDKQVSKKDWFKLNKIRSKKNSMIGNKDKGQKERKYKLFKKIYKD
jgi:hypothetical protein